MAPIEFEDHRGSGARENYTRWVRAVAEAKWIDKGLADLPWWKSARDMEEITPPETHPEAETFDGHRLEDERTTCTLGEFAQLFERVSDYAIEDLASPLKMSCLVLGRVELTLLGVSRYGFRASEISSLLKKHPSSMSRWLNQGLIWEREDPAFLARINSLDQQISAATRNIE